MSFVRQGSVPWATYDLRWALMMLLPAMSRQISSHTSIAAGVRVPYEPYRVLLGDASDLFWFMAANHADMRRSEFMCCVPSPFSNSLAQCWRSRSEPTLMSWISTFSSPPLPFAQLWHSRDANRVFHGESAGEVARIATPKIQRNGHACPTASRRRVHP